MEDPVVKLFQNKIWSSLLYCTFVYKRHLNLLLVVESIIAHVDLLWPSDNGSNKKKYTAFNQFISFVIQYHLEHTEIPAYKLLDGPIVNLKRYLLHISEFEICCLNLLRNLITDREKIKFIPIHVCYNVCSYDVMGKLLFTSHQLMKNKCSTFVIDGKSNSVDETIMPDGIKSAFLEAYETFGHPKSYLKHTSVDFKISLEQSMESLDATAFPAISVRDLIAMPTVVDHLTDTR
jgi:hypothetical protein